MDDCFHIVFLFDVAMICILLFGLAFGMFFIYHSVLLCLFLLLVN